MHGEVVRGLIVDIMIVLASGLVAGMICRRLNISMLIGYLTVGVLIGHGGLGLITDRDHYLEELAHAGALFLLFSVGIEFSVDHLRKMSRYIVVGGSLQMILVAVPLVIACRIDGLSWPAAALAGSAGALSSTILVFKALSEVGQATAPHGRRAMGILLFQDLALVPMLLLVPLLTGTGESPDVMTFVLLDERQDSINDGYFVTEMDGYPNPRTTKIVDYPASYHALAAGFAFADGHSEIHKWKDSRTFPALRMGVPLQLNVPSPNNPDVLWMQDHCSY